MKLTFKTDKGYLLQEEFNRLLPDSLSMNQYELAELTQYSAEDWSEFLHDGSVQKEIESENALIAKANMRKLIGGAADNDRSVGAAQMINAMAKVDDGDKAEDHFYIYSYVPLTENETHAPLVRQEETWRPPNIIKEEVKTEKEEQLEKYVDTKIDIPKEINDGEEKIEDDDWF